MEVRGLARPTLGKRDDTRESNVLLISRDGSSLVIDRLCRRAVEENTAVACFYFDFATHEERSPAVILGSVLK